MNSFLLDRVLDFLYHIGRSFPSKERNTQLNADICVREGSGALHLLKPADVEFVKAEGTGCLIGFHGRRIQVPEDVWSLLRQLPLMLLVNEADDRNGIPESEEYYVNPEAILQVSGSFPCSLHFSGERKFLVREEASSLRARKREALQERRGILAA